MAIITDATGRQLAQAVGGIDTGGLAKDTTLQATNTALGNMNATQQGIATAITNLGNILGSDKANIDGSNIVNPSAFRSAIGAQESISSITVTTSKERLPVAIKIDTIAPDFGYVACYGGTQGTTLTVDTHNYSVSPSQMLRVPVAKGDIVKYVGGGYTYCNIYYQKLTASINV